MDDEHIKRCAEEIYSRITKEERMGDDINITAIEFVNGEDMLMQIDLHNVSTNEYWRTFITCKEFFRMVKEGS